MDGTIGRTEPGPRAGGAEYAPGAGGAEYTPRADILERAPPRTEQYGKLQWLLLLVLTAAAAGIALRVHPHGAFTPAAPAPSVPLRAPAPLLVGDAVVTAGDMPVMLQGLGTVVPLATVVVKTQISGPLTEVAFREGQLVHKGDFLAQIDPRPYQIAQAQAEGQMAHDQALLKTAQLDLARYQLLNKQDSIAKQVVDTQLYLTYQYQGTLQSDQAAIDNAKLNLVYCHIVSPIDGRVGLRQVDAGNYVQTTDPAGIVVITQLQPITVTFTLAEDDLPLVMRRLDQGATLAVTAYDRADIGRLASGTLATVDNQIDVTTGTVKLRATFPNDDHALFPNQFVNAHLLVDTLSQVPLMPEAAVQHGAPGSFVWLIGADGTVSARPVRLGPADGERVAVLAGLVPGDRVVTDGADRLRAGAHVSIAAAQAAVPVSGPADARAPVPAGSSAAPADAAAARAAHRHHQ